MPCECLCGVGVGFTVSVWGFQSFGLVMFGAPGTALPGALPGPPFPWTPFPWTAQNFALFFPSLGVFSWDFGGVLKHRDPSQCARCGVLGLSCEAPAAPLHPSGPHPGGPPFGAQKGKLVLPMFCFFFNDNRKILKQ